MYFRKSSTELLRIKAGCMKLDGILPSSSNLGGVGRRDGLVRLFIVTDNKIV